MTQRPFIPALILGYWLMGGSGVAVSTAQVLDLTGYTQVAVSNVSFSPASNSTLTINSATSITATSSTKTITEVLLFQKVSDPIDVPLLYSTQPPFTITFTPARMGSATFVAFAVFSDNTFATTTLSYTLQPSGSLLGLNLVNAPVASMPVGSSAIVRAQAIFSNGAVDISQAATYRVRSGTARVISVSSSGVVTANGPGVDWLDVSYNGVTASAGVTAGSCIYALSPTNQLVGVNGGSASIQVTTAASCAWTADDGGASWLTATNTSGTGSGIVTVTATANAIGGTQGAIISVAGQHVAITQPATACTYGLSQTQVNASAAGARGSITVTTSCPVISSSNQSWLMVTPLASSVAYSVAPNSGSQRNATLIIGTQSVSVVQAGMLPPVVPSSQIATTASGLAYSRVSQTFNGTVTLKNISSSAINGTLQIVFMGLPANVTLVNATGNLSGVPYLTFPSVAVLAPGQSVTVNVQFKNPSNATINFIPVIYSGSLN